MPPQRTPNVRDAGIFAPREIPKYYGVYRGQVYSNEDPQASGRVQVSLPFLGSMMWALVASPTQPCRAEKKDTAAGSDPANIIQPGDMVVVAFEGGDASHPIVIGRLGS